MTNPSGRDGRGLLDASTIFAGCLAVYLTFGQSVFFKADGHHLVLRLVHGDSHYPHHKLYMPLLLGFARLLEPLGLTPYRTATVFSAVGVALGVALTHAGFRRLGSERRAAWLATLLVALCPACFFFATVVEFHGPFLAAAGLAFLATAALAAQPSWTRAALCGLASGIAAGMHASGLVLPGLLLPFCLAVRREALAGQLPPALLRFGLAAAVHGGVCLILAKPGEAGGFVDKGFHHPQGIEHLPGVLLVEWLIPFLPLSLTVLTGLSSRSTRLTLLAFAIGFLPYAVAALRLLVGDAESGAYLLPLAIPAAWITVAGVVAWRLAAPALVAISAVLAMAGVLAHDDDRAYRAYADGLKAALGGQPAFLLLGDPAELGPCLVYAPEARVYLLDIAATMPPAALEAVLGPFDGILAAQRREGRPVLLTAGGRRFLSLQSPLLPGASRLLAHIEATYQLLPVASGTFEAWRLEPR